MCIKNSKFSPFLSLQGAQSFPEVLSGEGKHIDLGLNQQVVALKYLLEGWLIYDSIIMIKCEESIF